MSQIVVTGRGSNKALMIKAQLTASIVHMVAEAFTDKFDDEAPIHDLLVAAFGKTRYRWYAIDMSGEVWNVTFSNVANPPVMTFNKMPAQIASPEWTLTMQEVDLIRPGRLSPNARHPHFIDRA